MFVLGLIFVLGACYGQTITPCQDAAPDSCRDFLLRQPDLCKEASFSTIACPETCGTCSKVQPPLQCYDCSGPVLSPELCNTTRSCDTGSSCVLRTFSAPDGHTEYMMTCLNSSHYECSGTPSVVGKRESTYNVHCCEKNLCNKPDTACPVDLIFVINDADEVPLDGFEKLKGFAHHVVQRLKVGPQDANVGLVTVDKSDHRIFHLNYYTTKDHVLSAIDNASRTGGSKVDMDEALEYVHDTMFTRHNGDRHDVPNVVIVLTEGVSSDVDKTSHEASSLHHESHNVIAIGVGATTNAFELHAIATDDKHALTVSGYDSLDSVLNNVVAMVCANPSNK